MQKKVVNKSVLELARERVAHTFDRFDHVSVLFSGGKDSTVCLELALEEAIRRGRLPLDVVFYDEEALSWETIDYIDRTRKRLGVGMRWYCIPVKHRNACSTREPFWHPWAPEKRDLWCRPLPEGAITELEGFDRRAIPECPPLIYPPSLGQVGAVMGIRAGESLRRYRSVTRRVHENYIAQVHNADWVYMVKPIYDWRTEDVWTAPNTLGWDYNRAYDVMEKAGISRHEQRVCPPYGEEPLRNLWMYSECWPDLWEKMLHRVPGANAAMRYSKSPVYGYSGTPEKPADVTWQEAIAGALEKWPRNVASNIAHEIKLLIGQHNKDAGGDPIPEKEPHPKTGVSWPFLYSIALRGDLKGRRAGNRLTKVKAELRK